MRPTLQALSSVFALTLTACVPDSGAPPQDPEEAAAPAEIGLATAEPVTWQCGEERIETRFDEEAVVLDLPDRRLRLPAVVSASGARYEAEGVVFWTKGMGEATLQRDGEHNGDTIECFPTEGRSPWAEARERGIAFRAVGNEPGWLAEVALGEAPRMLLSLDYGERELDVPLALPTAEEEGSPGFRGQADDVTTELRIEAGECIDSMSGVRFTARAEVWLDGALYAAGCGHYLLD